MIGAAGLDEEGQIVTRTINRRVSGRVGDTFELPVCRWFIFERSTDEGSWPVPVFYIDSFRLSLYGKDPNLTPEPEKDIYCQVTFRRFVDDKLGLDVTTE